MSEQGFAGIDNEDLKNFDPEKIKILLENVENLENSTFFDSLDIDGSQTEESEAELKIKNQLNGIGYQMHFLKKLHDSVTELKKEKGIFEQFTDYIEETYDSFSNSTQNSIQDPLENYRYIKESKAIKESDLNEIEREYLVNILKEGQLILNGAKSKDTAIFTQIQDTYRILSYYIGISHKGNVENIALINKKTIRTHFQILLQLKEKYKIKERGFKKEETTEVVLSQKSIEDEWTKDEAILALQYSQKKYPTLSQADFSDKALSMFIGKEYIDELTNQYEARVFQEQLINIILGNDDGFETGYNNEYLVGFSDKGKKGNYLIKISDFESQVNGKNAEEINSMELANYFLYLKENGILSDKKLIDTFGKETLIGLGKIWKLKGADLEGQYARQILIDNGLGDIIENIINYDIDYLASLDRNKLKEIINSSSDDPDEKEIMHMKVEESRIQKKIKILIKLGKKEEAEIYLRRFEKYKLSNLRDTQVTEYTFGLLEIDSDMDITISKEIDKGISPNVNLFNNYGIPYQGVEDNEILNMTLEELTSILLKIENKFDVIRIIQEIDDKNFIILREGESEDDYNNVNIQSRIINSYVERLIKKTNSITPNSENISGTEKHIQDFLLNLDLFNAVGICPDAEPIIELRKKLLKLKERKMIKDISLLYPGLPNAGILLSSIINEQIGNAKEGKKYCTIDITETILEFDKEHLKYKKDKRELTQEDVEALISGILEIEKTKVEVEIENTLGKPLHTLIGETNNPYILKKLSEIENIERRKEFFNSLNENEYLQILEGIKEGKDAFEIKKDIENKREAKKVNIANNILNREQQNADNNIYEHSDGISRYYKDSGTLSIKDKDGKFVKLKLTKKEQTSVELDPTNLDNIITFYNFYDKLNMVSVFHYRKDLSIAMNDVYINTIDNNSLSDNELIRFSIKLIRFINKIPLENGEKGYNLTEPTSLTGIRNQLRIYSGANSDLSDNATANNLKEDKFGNDLRRLGIIGTNMGFEHNQFGNILNGK